MKDIKDLMKVVMADLALQIQGCRGLEVFVDGQNLFEQWIEVELCSALLKNGVKKLEVETKNKQDKNEKYPDIHFMANEEECAIELKIRITKGGGGITNPKKIIEDIEKLQGYPYRNRIIIFVGFPLENEKAIDQWKKSRKVLYDIDRRLENQQLEKQPIEFSNRKKGFIFWGFIPSHCNK